MPSLCVLLTQGRRRSAAGEKRHRSAEAVGRGTSRPRRPDPDLSESSDTDDVSVSPTALSISSEDTSDDDDDDGRNTVVLARRPSPAASQPVEKCAFIHFTSEIYSSDLGGTQAYCAIRPLITDLHV